MKDESTLPTGSTKHRTVAAMFCHAIASGNITETTQVITATAGPVATAAAHFATLLNLPSTALVPAKAAEEVLARIEKKAAAGNGRNNRRPHCNRRPAHWPTDGAGTSWTTSPPRSPP